MRFILFLGIYLGALGAGFSMLGAAATLQQHGLKEWKTAAIFVLLAVIAWGIVGVSAKVNEDIASRESEARKCGCRQCHCAEMQGGDDDKTLQER